MLRPFYETNESNAARWPREKENTMKQRLNDKSLDRFPGTKSKRGKKYPHIVARSYGCESNIVYLTNNDYWNSFPDAIYENDWIPSKVAALILGVSKQAISDRIKRETLEHRDGTSGTGVKMVRLMDCRKKKKAGRPKGSTAVKVKGLNRDGFEVPVYFLCITEDRNGKTEYRFLKHADGYIYDYTDETFTEEIPDPDRDTIPYTDACMSGTIETKRNNTYVHHHKCKSIEFSTWKFPDCPGATHTNWNGNTPQIKLIPGEVYRVRPMDKMHNVLEAKFVVSGDWYYFKADGLGIFPVKDNDIEIIEKQTTIENFTNETIKCSGTILDEERYTQMLAHYEQGHSCWGIQRLMDPEGEHDTEWWEEAFDNMIDWALDKGLLA